MFGAFVFVAVDSFLSKSKTRWASAASLLSSTAEWHGCSWLDEIIVAPRSAVTLLDSNCGPNRMSMAMFFRTSTIVFAFALSRPSAWRTFKILETLSVERRFLVFVCTRPCIDHVLSQSATWHTVWKATREITLSLSDSQYLVAFEPYASCLSKSPLPSQNCSIWTYWVRNWLSLNLIHASGDLAFGTKFVLQMPSAQCLWR